MRTAARLVAGLGRRERSIDVSPALARLQSKRVLVTGAAGAIGQPLVQALRDAGVAAVPTDVDTSAPWGCQWLDVTDFQSCLQMLAFHKPDLVVNLAAQKLAPAGETNPWGAANVNTLGTMNLLNVGARVLLASTCKAIRPETAYGASKLIAERMVLNHGGSVARYVNVPECGPSMLSVWDALPADASIPVTPCTRYVITLREAIALTLWAAVLPPGRYKLDAGDPVSMADYASRVFPGRPQVEIPPRRGDRIDEPHHGDHETVEPTGVEYVERVVSWNDGGRS